MGDTGGNTPPPPPKQPPVPGGEEGEEPEEPRESVYDFFKKSDSSGNPPPPATLDEMKRQGEAIKRNTKELEERYRYTDRLQNKRLAEMGLPTPPDPDVLRNIQLAGLATMALDYVGGAGLFEYVSTKQLIASFDALGTLRETLQDRMIPKALGYLRDSYGAYTVGDAIRAVREGRVPQEIVELWIDKGGVGVDPLDTAMVTAYPSLAGKMKEAKAKGTEEFREKLARKYATVNGIDA
jgi:hypothetical protein